MFHINGYLVRKLCDGGVEHSVPDGGTIAIQGVCTWVLSLIAVHGASPTSVRDGSCGDGSRCRSCRDGGKSYTIESSHSFARRFTCICCRLDCRSSIGGFGGDWVGNNQSREEDDGEERQHDEIIKVVVTEY